MHDPEVLIDPAPPREPAPAPTTTQGRTVSVRVAVAASLAAALLAFGVGYAIHASDAGAASDRDDLSRQLDRTERERDRVRATLAVTEGTVDTCQETVQEATVLAADADDFTGDWQHLGDLMLQYAASAVGSAEEAELELRMSELAMQLDTKAGALEASADRVTADATCRET